MYFTQEDYRKIEKWLLANSVKDTEFAGASLPLKGNETVAFVQDGKNVKAPVKSIVDQLFLLGVSDFLNITDKYGESYITLEKAIQLIPYRSRKIGQVITFLDIDGNWNIYQFKGQAKNQWNNTTLWVDIIKSIIVDSILPDEEDLTGVKIGNNEYLKFKNKDYNTLNFSGLGRIYMRENITSIEDTTTGEVKTINYLSQQAINKANTIYHIQYDYDLNGETITIPENCVLYFAGGSIGNGTLVAQNTVINTALCKIFDSIEFRGKFVTDYVYPEWFGAKGDLNTENSLAGTDDSEAFTQALKVSYELEVPIYLTNSYLISKEINTTYPIRLVGSRIASGYEGKDKSSTIGVKGCTAFVMQGEIVPGNYTMTAISVKNIKVRSDYTGNFIETDAAGAPPRLGMFYECDFEYLSNVITFNNNNKDTSWGIFTIDKCRLGHSNSIIKTNSSGIQYRTLTNLAVTNCNISSLNSTEAMFQLSYAYGPVSFRNNIVESVPSLVKIENATQSAIVIDSNYFENISGNIADILGYSAKTVSVEFTNNSVYIVKPKLRIWLCNITKFSGNSYVIRTLDDYSNFNFYGCEISCYIKEFPFRESGMLNWYKFPIEDTQVLKDNCMLLTTGSATLSTGFIGWFVESIQAGYARSVTCITTKAIPAGSRIVITGYKNSSSISFKLTNSRGDVTALRNPSGNESYIIECFTTLKDIAAGENLTIYIQNIGTQPTASELSNLLLFVLGDNDLVSDCFYVNRLNRREGIIDTIAPRVYNTSNGQRYIDSDYAQEHVFIDAWKNSDGTLASKVVII